LTNNNGAGAYPLNVRNDTWYHVAITCDGQKMYKYWDGELIGEYEIPSDYIGNYLTGTMSVGDTGNYCYLNDVRVYDHCLSMVEIKEISRGLVLHYKLDEPLAENAIVRDCSGYGNNGTITKNLIMSNNSPRYRMGILAQDTDAYYKITKNNLNLPDGPVTLSF
jgi:hypothetical protein